MRQFAKERLKHWVRVLLHTKDSPERTSFAFALGVFIAFLPPVPWFHTIIALILAFTFRLNRLAVLAGTYVNSPFTIAPLLVLELSVGVTLLGGGMEIPELTLRQFASAQGWRDAFEDLYPYFEPLMAGSILLGLVGAGIAYLLVLNLIRVYRQRLAVAAATAAAAAATAVAHAAQHAADAATKAVEKARAEAGLGHEDGSGAGAAASHEPAGRAPGGAPTAEAAPRSPALPAAPVDDPETRS